MKKFLSYFLSFISFVQIGFGQNLENYQDEKLDKEKTSKSKIFKEHMTQIIPAYLLFGQYAFLYGVTLGGDAISRGKTPEWANTIWLVTPLMGGFLISQGTKETKRELFKNKEYDDVFAFFYTIYYLGPDISSINNFEAKGEDGKWTAKVLKANTSINYPPMGFRTGFYTNSLGLDFEMSLSAHHSKKQTAFYNFTGEIYNEQVGGYVELPTSMEIDLPSHFLMLHSLYTGINAFYSLPNFGIITPYIGIGAGMLYNSVQSEYPGPANLVQEKNTLALDDMSFNWGGHGFLGFRYSKSDSFYYFELRPTFHHFKYNSGGGRLSEIDGFTLESLQFQFGIGTSLFK
tara:strand:+ start:1197 stop:2231 length:1035 start_codon:yes stop_codon:yes gene_type:complete